MIRMLFIGRGTPSWIGDVDAVVSPTAVELDYALLPAEGIRRIDERPPDVVVIVGPQSDARLGNLLEGIRSRPVGGLAPVVLLADRAPPLDVEPLVDLRLDLAIDARDLVARIAQLLEVDIEITGVRRQPPSNVAPAVPAASSPPSERVDEHAIEAKWREVRQENYFVILELEPPATADAVDEALRRQRARFSPANVPDALAARWQTALDEIRDALLDAEAVLSDPRLREEYARHHR